MPPRKRRRRRTPETAELTPKVVRGNYPKPPGTVTSAQAMREALVHAGRVEVPLGRGAGDIKWSVRHLPDLASRIRVTKLEDRYVGVVEGFKKPRANRARGRQT